ncbi:MAG: translation elongation factor 4 [Patescibacteria group bacterium]
MDISRIRNFSIIAHIDHGKSTLADRMLELTHTVETRKMKEQVLDSMELERERGITIKLQPVRMTYNLHATPYTLNLIDTPGHIDFSYEVSRALKAVEGAILLVDATQGVQAQTLSVLQMAREAGLVIIPVLSKVDSPIARIDDIRGEIVSLLGCVPEDVLETSGKTGQGVVELLSEIVKRVPPPKEEFEGTESARAFVFDFSYSTHKGIIVYVKVWDGTIRKGDALSFIQAKENCTVLETGVFAPESVAKDELSAGEIGYIITGLKRSRIAAVGDTLTRTREPLPALSGYKKPQPVVWASVYTESQDDFHMLAQSLGRLQLEDPAFSFEEETSGIMGRGFRCGFLGMLHAEIITERLRREFNLPLVVATPSITYRIIQKDGTERTIYSPPLFPDDGTYEKAYEPWVRLRIILPHTYIGSVMRILHEHETIVGETETWGVGRISLSAEMPLRELMRNFFDELKSASSGYASLSYEIIDEREADVTRLDLLVADEPVTAFTRVVSSLRVSEEAEKSVERLFNVLPRQMFTVKIQGRALGRIISSRTLSAFRKDVTAKLYGGDVTRKMKLLEKQKKGKKKMKAGGKVDIPPDVFLKMMRSGE